MNKKNNVKLIRTILFGGVLALGISSKAFAINGDIYNIEDENNIKLKYTQKETANFKIQKQVSLNSHKYGYEVNRKVYRFDELSRLYGENKFDFDKAIEALSLNGEIIEDLGDSLPKIISLDSNEEGTLFIVKFDKKIKSLLSYKELMENIRVGSLFESSDLPIPIKIKNIKVNSKSLEIELGNQMSIGMPTINIKENTFSDEKGNIINTELYEYNRSQNMTGVQLRNIEIDNENRVNLFYDYFMPKEESASNPNNYKVKLFKKIGSDSEKDLYDISDIDVVRVEEEDGYKLVLEDFNGLNKGDKISVEIFNMSSKYGFGSTRKDMNKAEYIEKKMLEEVTCNVDDNGIVTWNNVDGAVSYDVVLYEWTSGVRHVSKRIPVNGNMIDLKLYSDLLPGRNYYVAVNAKAALNDPNYKDSDSYPIDGYCCMKKLNTPKNLRVIKDEFGDDILTWDKENWVGNYTVKFYKDGKLVKSYETYATCGIIPNVIPNGMYTLKVEANPYNPYIEKYYKSDESDGIKYFLKNSIGSN